MECLKDINIEIQTIGHTVLADQNNWECIKFNIKINGQNFDYHSGMACTKRIYDNSCNGGTLLSSNKILAIKNEGYTVKVNVPVKYKNIVDDIKIFQVPHLVKPPKIENVLHCLFLDSQAHNECFQDWCFELGYDNDSIKAKSIYEACIENYFKLKKALGAKYTEIETEIQKLEL